MAQPASVAIPYTTVPRDDAEPMSLALLLAPDGRIVASSYPARYQVGERVGELGGTFQLDASPGQGTRVRILLPAGR